MVPFSWEGFREWLDSQPLRREVLRASTSYCPIAQYLRETNRIGYVFVGDGTYRVGPFKLKPLPEIAHRFLLEFDNGKATKSSIRTARAIAARIEETTP